jgi:predicted transposase YdaD
MLDISLKESRVYQEGRQEGRQEGKQEGRQEGRQEGATQLLVRMLEKRFGSLSEEIRLSISQLPLLAIEELSEALLEFSSVTDLQSWLLEKKSN